MNDRKYAISKHHFTDFDYLLHYLLGYVMLTFTICKYITISFELVYDATSFTDYWYFYTIKTAMRMKYDYDKIYLIVLLNFRYNIFDRLQQDSNLQFA